VDTVFLRGGVMGVKVLGPAVTNDILECERRWPGWPWEGMAMGSGPGMEYGIGDTLGNVKLETFRGRTHQTMERYVR